MLDKPGKENEPRDHSATITRLKDISAPTAEAPVTDRDRGATTQPAPEIKAAPAKKGKSKRLRRLLLILGPVVVIVAGLAYYLMTGRYISTEDAYVGANAVMIAPQVEGSITNVDVKENQHVKAGDVLFQIDPVPYQTAVDKAQGALNQTRIDLAALKAQYKQSAPNIKAARESLDVAQKNYKRISDLAKRGVSTASDLDNAHSQLATAQGSLSSLIAGEQQVLAQLGGNPDLPLEKYPPYEQALATLNEADRDLKKATVRAPIDGIVTQTSSLVPGRYLAVGTTATAMVDNSHFWVDANEKETDLTHVKPGDPATVTIDAYPDRTFKGKVETISPGTGSTFALIPAQNASGNWVKVVQRISVRVKIDRQPGDPVLRAGMSASVSIDTGHKRSLSDLY